MPDKKGNLYLFEAIELRNEYDRQIKLIEGLVDDGQSKRDRLFHSSNKEDKEPAADFDQQELEEKLKKLQTKRIKLNQTIQMANFNAEIDHEGEKISIAEALEIRKKLIGEKEAVSQRVLNSAYKRVIHKEERDIVHEPRQPFKETFEEFQNSLRKLRHLINQIHVANHETTINFKDE